MTRRLTGSDIRALRQARGWSQQRLADELATVEGRGPGNLDRHSVYRWESAKRVPAYWMPFLEKVLSPSADAAEPEEPGSPPHSGDTVASILALGRWDMIHRRNFLAASSGYAIAALALDPDSLVRRTRAAEGGTRLTVGQGEVEAVERVTLALGDAAAELGGAVARPLAVHYLVEMVGPWLDEGVYTEKTGKALFAAAGSLSHLCGWMSSDTGNDGLAERYYTNAFHLAQQAGDSELAATTLRGLAIQAVERGKQATAVRLAEQASSYAPAVKDSRAVAYYQTTLAQAAALDADHRRARTALAAGEKAIANAPAGPGISWASHYSAGRWAHETGLVLARLGESDAAEQHLRHALDVYGLDRRRTRAIVLADLGQVLARRGDIDGAATAWTQFLDYADGIRSAKILDGLADMRARIGVLPTTAVTAALSERAADLLGHR